VTVITYIIITGRKQQIYTALKVDRQCPLVLLVKVGPKQGEDLGSEEGSLLVVECCEYATGEKTLSKLHITFHSVPHRKHSWSPL
jgi:hypothetical protein